MDLYQTVILAILQGITEFLPISSSAHLVIPSLILQWPDQGLAFDVAVHVGTLSAVIIFYRRDVGRLTAGWLASLRGAPPGEESRQVWYLAIATVPVVLVGLGAGDFIEDRLRTLPVIAATTLVFGLLLGVAERRAPGGGPGRALTLPVAIVIGLAQAVAPVPGVSRSGVTITAALILGIGRRAAARFSFLLSIPVIAGAGMLKAWELGRSPGPVEWAPLALGALLAGVTAYACIALFLRLLERVGLMPFVYYRIVLALCLFGIWVA